MSAWLPVLAVLAPLLLALLLIWRKTRKLAQALAPWAAVPALAAVVLAPLDAAGWIEWPGILLGLRFGLDATGHGFLLLAALLWTLAGIAARAYHRDDEHRTALWAAWLAAMAGNLWLIVAQDMVGFYAGFALMSFAGYVLVIHTRSVEAYRAGRVYLVMALLGEAALLAGLLLLVSTTGSSALPLAQAAGNAGALTSLLLFIGLGVKAGVLGLHVWLPLAHPVAPTPASAVLSGVMIKAGVLGWLRLLPMDDAHWPVLGLIAMGLGLGAALLAIALGLAQRNPKTVLAYSSISQMGYLTLGLGAAWLHPPAWPALSAAMAFYALHHGLAKGALFLGVAAIPAHGTARRMDLGLQALPALALAGLPWTSGAWAKGGLKEALATLAAPWPDLLGLLLLLAAVGTSMLMTHLLLLQARPTAQPHPGMRLPWLLAVLTSLGLGVLASLQAELPTLEELVPGLLPVLLGAALVFAVLRRWPGLAQQQQPAVPPGDLLTLLLPPIRRSTQWLYSASAWFDRPRKPHSGNERLLIALDWIDATLRRPTLAGLLLPSMLLLLLLLAKAGD